MKKILIFLLFFPLLGSKNNSSKLLPPRPGKDLAVFFAVEKYQNPKLGNLQNPVRNARDIATELKNRFGFETELLENPTLDQIEQKIESVTRDFADGKRARDGQLILFFSGHGMTEYENGFFLPADSDPSRPQRTAFAYEYWRPKINAINCRHILVAIDACYSVRFDPDWKNKPEGQFKRPGEMTEAERALANYEAYKARVFFTSDNKEDQTPDRSNFAKKLLEGLRSGTAKDGFLTSKQLFANHIEGATPTPRAGTFGDDEASSAFLFYEKTQTPAPGNSPTEQDKAFWRSTQNTNTLDAYRRYLRECKLCLYSAEAEAAILAGTPKPQDPPNSGHNTEQPEKTKPKAPESMPDGMVLISGGTFKMGCTSEQKDCSSDEKPVHDVTLSDFYLGKHEVTQKLWRDIMGSDPPELAFKGCDQCPVERVSWDEVQEFLKKLNAKYAGGQAYRLPTEAEWEYAAREGGKAVLFGNGKNVLDPAEANFDASASYKKIYSVAGAYRQKTTPVGTFAPNALGLYDMAGNVWEWCSDWKDTYPAAAQTNPKGPASGSYRVMRGGSWDDVPQDCRVAIRSYYAPGYRYFYVGFRLARTK